MSDNLNGAVLVIGSLFWENENNAIDKKQGKARDDWRRENLDLDRAEKIKIPIRYGRKSESRYCTYTMLFSNSCPTMGSGYLIPFKSEIKINSDDFAELKNQAIRMAKVEGICKKDESKIFKKWGVLALTITDTLKLKEGNAAQKLTNFWKELFNDFTTVNDFRIDDKEATAITEDGFANFNFEIPESLNGIDFIFSTPVMPNISSYPSPERIAQAMIESKEKYFAYFVENLNHEITTYQDTDILTFLPDVVKATLNQKSS